MKILIIDREESAVNLASNALQAAGHQVVYEPSKNAALDRLSSEDFDLVIIDPSPLTSAKPIVLNIRRAARNYPYIILSAPGHSQDDAIKAGMNDYISKPFNKDLLLEKAENAEFLLDLIRRLGDESEDFPSAGGVIAKSAFNQLFLSAMDRADRYGEKTFILFITIGNYKEIKDMDGPYAAEYATASLSKFLVVQRRQSDIIGQTEKFEYALLLQRPVYETEPLEAARRFAEAFANHTEPMTPAAAPLEIVVRLIDVPTGETVSKHVVHPGNPQAATVAGLA